MNDELLKAAYALRTPDDSRRLYAAWAETYDSTFAQATGYRIPALVAAAFAAEGGAGPVIDIGAGTGLVGAALGALGIGPVDGADISPQMLAIAAGRGYRHLIEADVTAGLALPEGGYAGAISAGTFTMGHLGPEALAPVLRLVAPGGLVAITVNLQHYAQAGFAAAFATLPITDLRQTEEAIYAAGSAGHSGDTAMIVTFRRKAQAA